MNRVRESELLAELADRVVAAGRSRASRSRRSSRRGARHRDPVYEGEVERFVGASRRASASASSPTAGRASPTPARSTTTCSPRRWPRPATTSRSARPTSALGLAEPDGVAVAELDLCDESLESFPTDRKIELAIELERATLAADPRVAGVESAEYADAIGEAAVVTTTGIRTRRARERLLRDRRTLADEGDETQTGLRVLGRAAPRTSSTSPRPRPRRPSGPRACSARPSRQRAAHRRARPVRHRAVPRHHRRHAQRRGGAQGPVAVRRPPRRRGRPRRSSRWSTTRPNPLAYTATEIDGEGLAARRNALIDGGVLQEFVHNAYTARRLGDGVDRHRRCAAASSRTPGVGCLRVGDRARHALTGRADRRRRRRRAHPGRPGLHSGVNPVSGDFSTGAEGLRIRGGSWPSRCASSRSPRRCSACCRTCGRSATTSSGCPCARPASASSSATSPSPVSELARAGRHALPRRLDRGSRSRPTWPGAPPRR